jgi:hypothetical protein
VSQEAALNGPELIPTAVRIALRNAVGGWGPYTVAGIDDLFNSYDFFDRDPEVPDAGGQRRTRAEEYQALIAVTSPRQARRYLSLVEEVLTFYPDNPQEQQGVGPQLRRRLRQAGIDWGASGRLELPGAEAEAVATLNVATGDLWHEGRIRIFISHTSAHRAEVGDLASALDRTFSCFVAHDAIEPTAQWQMAIERALRTCDVLLAYVTADFNASRWTDQEVGWALGREIPIVAIRAGADPYGFFGSYQALRIQPDTTSADEARAVSRSIATAIFTLQRPQAQRLIPQMAAAVVRAFCDSRSFEATRRQYLLMQRIPSSAWTVELLETVKMALRSNEHVRDCVLDTEPPTTAPQALNQLLDRAGWNLPAG